MCKRSPVPRGSADSRTLQKIEDATVISFTGEDLRQVGVQNLKMKQKRRDFDGLQLENSFEAGRD